MAKFQISYVSNQPTEVIEADEFEDVGHEGRWLEFYRKTGSASRERLLRVPAGDVRRIERV